ncbi:caldesmon-like [Palaemon carinicauda]|uniref:caldesmon-like n=1 Tax=Palaemon carinicauda TaxID=392227 RepID=UPI0035B62048
MEVIEQISEQRLELQKSLDEARINDLIRNGRYKCLLQELETLKKENLNKLSDFEQQNIQLREELEKFKSDKNVSLKDELLAANEIIPSLKEELEGGDKKKENRPGMRKVRLNRTSLEISTEMDVKNGQKADVQKDVRDNKSEEKVVEAQDQDANGRKAEKEEVGGASGVGQVVGWLLASKGALHDTNNRQEEQKLQKETSTDEEKEEKEEEGKQEEEKIAKRTTRKPIVFDLEPEKPKRAISSSDSSHITFQGEKVRATTTRDYGLNGYVTVDLNVLRKFHRAIYGVEGRTLMEITRQSGKSAHPGCRRRNQKDAKDITLSTKEGQTMANGESVDRPIGSPNNPHPSLAYKNGVVAANKGPNEFERYSNRSLATTRWKEDPQRKRNRKEEVEKEKENVQKTLEERINFLEKELEAAFAEISLRKEEESKFLAENEELRAENEHLSNIIGTLQVDKKIEMENLAIKNDYLE